jgi:hypothetical protein
MNAHSVYGQASICAMKTSASGEMFNSEQGSHAHEHPLRVLRAKLLILLEQLWLISCTIESRILYGL